MSEGDDYEVFLTSDSSIPDECIHPFVTAIAHTRMLAKVERRQSGAIYLAEEWYIPTAIVVGLAAPYFAAILSEAGREHYHAVRQGLSSIWATFFGQDRTIRYSVIASSPGKVDPTWEYSRALSVMARAKNGLAFKLFVDDASSSEELDAAFASFVNFITCVNSGVLNDTLAKRLQETRPSGGTVLLSYEPAQARICFIDARARRRVPTSTIPVSARAIVKSYAQSIGVFPYPRILKLHKAAISAQLAERRDALIAGLHPAFRATLPTSRVPGDQVLLDLTSLNLFESLQDGSFPFDIWLTTAVAMAGLRLEAQVFQEALEELRLPREDGSDPYVEHTREDADTR